MTPFLEPEYYLGIGQGPAPPIHLAVRLVSRDDLFANAHWISQKIADENLLNGDSNLKATTRHIKILTDLFNSLGWNPDLRNPSKSLDPGARWREKDGPATSTTKLAPSSVNCVTRIHS